MEARSPSGTRGPRPADGFSPHWPMRWRAATHVMASSASVRPGPWPGLSSSLGSDEILGAISPARWAELSWVSIDNTGGGTINLSGRGYDFPDVGGIEHQQHRH